MTRCVCVFLKDFHQLSQDLLLWLASAESRRQKARVTDPEADPQMLLECQEELMVSFFLGSCTAAGLWWVGLREPPLLFLGTTPAWRFALMFQSVATTAHPFIVILKQDDLQG